MRCPSALGRYFPLTPINPTHPWAAYQHQLNDTMGFALVFSRPQSSSTPRLLRMVSNWSDYTWSLTSATPGYFSGNFDTHTGANVTALEPCRALCASRPTCVGFTFCAVGRPVCESVFPASFAGEMMA